MHLVGTRAGFFFLQGHQQAGILGRHLWTHRRFLVQSGPMWRALQMRVPRRPTVFLSSVAQCGVRSQYGFPPPSNRGVRRPRCELQRRGLFMCLPQSGSACLAARGALTVVGRAKIEALESSLFGRWVLPITKTHVPKRGRQGSGTEGSGSGPSRLRRTFGGVFRRPWSRARKFTARFDPRPCEGHFSSDRPAICCSAKFSDFLGLRRCARRHIAAATLQPSAQYPHAGCVRVVSSGFSLCGGKRLRSSEAGSPASLGPDSAPQSFNLEESLCNGRAWMPTDAVSSGPGPAAGPAPLGTTTLGIATSTSAGCKDSSKSGLCVAESAQTSGRALRTSGPSSQPPTSTSCGPYR